MDPDHAAEIRERLHARLRGRPTPLMIFEDAVLPAASCWAGARAWIKAARAAGVVPGDGVVLHVEHGPVLIMVVVAALWEGWRLVLPEPGAPLDHTPGLAAREQARLCITDQPCPQAWVVSDWMSPGTPVLREVAAAARPATHWRLAGRDVPVLRVVQALRPDPELPTRIWVRQSWHTAEGLVGELLPALARAEEVFHDPLPPPEPSFTAWSAPGA